MVLAVLAAHAARAATDDRRPTAHPFSSSADARGAMELLEAWDVEGAESLLAELEKKAPDAPATRYVAGRVAFERGDYAQAAREYEEAFGDRAKDSDDWQLAAASEREMRGTVQEESAHFVLRYKPGRDALLVPYATDALEAQLRALGEDLGWKPARKVRVEFLTTPGALARLSDLPLEAVRTTGTVALCKYDKLLVSSPRALLQGYGWLDTLAHELTHLAVTRRSRNTVPIWLHEGIAKFLESRWNGAAGRAMEPGGEALLSRAVRRGTLVPFAKMHPSIALLPSAEEAALAYAEVFAAVELVHRKAGMAGLRAILDRQRDGQDFRQAVGGAVGMSFAQFEARWKESLRSRPAPPPDAQFERLVFRDEKKRESRKEREKSWDRGSLGTLANVQARKHAHLGELLRARGRTDAAAAELDKAVAIAGAEHPVLARKYAIVKLALGKPAEAERALRASLKRWPDEPANHALLGRVLAETGRAAEARGHLLAANAHDPFDPEIHEALLAAAKTLGDAGAVARETDVLAVIGGTKTTWTAALPGKAPEATGYLRIEKPGGARVFVDGVDTGLTTPVEEHALPAGKHVIRLEPEGAPPVERTVEVAPDALVPFES